MQGLSFWLLSLESPAGRSPVEGVRGGHYGNEIYQMPAPNEADAWKRPQKNTLTSCYPWQHRQVVSSKKQCGGSPLQQSLCLAFKGPGVHPQYSRNIFDKGSKNWLSLRDLAT